MMLDSGASLDRVDSELIVPSRLSPDQKAAVWLYAWLLVNGAQRASGARQRPSLVEGLG